MGSALTSCFDEPPLRRFDRTLLADSFYQRFFMPEGMGLMLKH